MSRTGIEFFFIDSSTIFIDIIIFLTVIFVFGSFTEYFLKKLFKIHDSYEEIPFLIRLNIKVVLGISLILILGSFASIFKILNQLYTIIAIIVISVCYFLTIILEKKYEFNWRHEIVKISPIILILISGSLLRILTLGFDGVIFPGDDIKFHSMYVELIRFNNGFSETFEPFLHQIAEYPPGFHVIVSFFSAIIGQSSTKTLTTFVCFAYGLVGLGIYSIAYALSRSEIASFGSSLSVLLINSQISFISLWGGVTLLVAFYFISTFLSFIYFDNNVHLGRFFKCIAGVSFVAGLITNTGLALIGLVFLAPSILRRIFSETVNFHVIKTHFKSVISPFLISSIIFFFLMIPLISPAIKFALGLVPADLVAPQTPIDILTYGADWYSFENFIPRLVIEHGIFMVVSLMASIPIFVYLSGVYVMTKTQKFTRFWFSYFSAFSWILILFIFGINNPKGLLFIEFPLWNLFTPARMFTFLLLPLCMLSGLLFQCVSTGIRQIRMHSDDQRHVRRRRCFILTIFVALLISICWVDYRTNQSLELLARNRIPISSDDLYCFEWIKENTSTDDRFLVEAIDAGQYIPSFCDRTAIYPFTGMQYDSSYVELKNEIHTDPDGIRALNLLHELEIDYVFVGSKIDWWRASNVTAFDADLLLTSLYYQLAFNSGASYVFEVKQDFGNDN